MTESEFEKIRKQIMLKMKFFDPTIKNITESIEYKESCAYNAGLRDAINILKKIFQNKKERCIA